MIEVGAVVIDAYFVLEKKNNHGDGCSFLYNYFTRSGAPTFRDAVTVGFLGAYGDIQVSPIFCSPRHISAKLTFITISEFSETKIDVNTSSMYTSLLTKLLVQGLLGTSELV